jgi:hypothetical protein
MLSFSILRFFLDSQFSETSQKSKKYSSSESDRDRIRIIYNKTAYERNVVIILLIKIRTNLNISLFDRISFKNIAMIKTLYFCLSNIKKIQYKIQAKQVIRSFLDQIKNFFNRWLSQFRAESAMKANFKLTSLILSFSIQFMTKRRKNSESRSIFFFKNRKTTFQIRFFREISQTIVRERETWLWSLWSRETSSLIFWLQQNFSICRESRNLTKTQTNSELSEFRLCITRKSKTSDSI